MDYGFATLQNLIPSFPWIAPPHALHPGAIQGKEGIKFCLSGNLGQKRSDELNIEQESGEQAKGWVGQDGVEIGHLSCASGSLNLTKNIQGVVMLKIKVFHIYPPIKQPSTRIWSL